MTEAPWHPVWGRGLWVSVPPAVHPPSPVVVRGRDYEVTLDAHKGGAIISLQHRGRELVSNVSAGDQWQIAVHLYQGTRWSNPTQAGGSGWDAWVPSPLASWWMSGSAAEMVAMPMEWEREAWGGELLWAGMRIGHRVDTDYAGLPGLIRHEAIITLYEGAMPAGEHSWIWCIAHTMPCLEVPYRLGGSMLVEQELEVIPPHPYRRSPAWDAECQSAVLATRDGSSALGVVAAVAAGYSHSEMSQHPRAGGTADCTRLGVARHNLGVPVGTTRMVSWWAVGTIDEVTELLMMARHHALSGAPMVATPRMIRRVRR